MTDRIPEFGRAQVEAVRDLFNEYLAEPISLGDLYAILAGDTLAGCTPVIKGRKKRYVIAIINAMGSTITNVRMADEFRHTASTGFGISTDTLRTETAKIVRRSRRSDAVKEALYTLMDETRERLSLTYCSDAEPNNARTF